MCATLAIVGIFEQFMRSVLSAVYELQLAICELSNVSASCTAFVIFGLYGSEFNAFRTTTTSVEGQSSLYHKITRYMRRNSPSQVQT